MGETLKKLLDKYREQWRYVLVGCGTTAINYVIYFALLNLLHIHYIPCNVIAWVGAVTFAYFANGAWVYNSTSHRGVAEAGAFTLSRLFSLGLETVLLFLLVELAHLDENLTKLFLQALVIVVNYVTGRMVYRAGKNN